ncbi:MAG: hypothetical protein ACTSQA_03240, partial [Candidatus Heimdallarchaeaceae archaeon]
MVEVKNGTWKQKNYVRNYQSNDYERRIFVTDFVEHFMDIYDVYLKTKKKNLVMRDYNPGWFQRFLFSFFYKHEHTGQVIPSEEAKLAIGIAGQVSLLPCVCRFANSGEKHHLCMLFMHIPDDTSINYYCFNCNKIAYHDTCLDCGDKLYYSIEIPKKKRKMTNSSDQPIEIKLACPKCRSKETILTKIGEW